MDEPTELKTPSATRARESRFTPGAMLADRFRIVALLGKGGMGEVYRAEDVKLGQQVALKFLPDADASKLERLYREVRLGRQISHPNVCRLYDVVEWEGHHFITMEYIDGEDLASLLRRIGKLPPDKALDIARDLCAGLASAHVLGIVHRDLKPANVMIDGRGAARITDFGLAGLIEDQRSGEISGTPGYMAPEQVAGGEITPRTDLYALGLILSEVFTGKRGLSSQDQIDPAVQRIIARCLEERPESRPPSIHSVIAALPGGDPLQAAVAAGETPSPEMVAAAGETGELTVARGWALLIAAALLIVISAGVSQRVMLYGIASFPKKPEVLAERAREILAGAGYTRPPVGVSYTFGWNNDFFDRGPKNADLNRVIPSPVVFYYRESPRELFAIGAEHRVTAVDPPMTLSGMANVEIDAAGRLISFAVVPPQVEDPPAVRKPVDWGPFIALTGLDSAAMRPATPKWRVPVDSDAKTAWEGGGTRIEAASHHGRPVWFSVIGPWKEADRGSFAGALVVSHAAQVLQVILAASLLGAGVFFARRNLLRSRGDRTGAMRLAFFAMILVFLMRFLRVDHVLNLADEGLLLAELAAEALLAGATGFLIYAAIEPYFRRRWPRLLIGWTRLLSGRLRDPMVGRDVLIGALAGSLCAIIAKSPYFVLPPLRSSFTALTELRHLVYMLLDSVYRAVAVALFVTFFFLLVRLVLRSTAAATVALVPLIVVILSVNGAAPLEIAANAAAAIIMVLIFRRYGLLAVAALTFFFGLGIMVPLTLDPAAWFFGRSLFAIVLAITIAACAFRISLGAKPLFGMALLEEE